MSASISPYEKSIRVELQRQPLSPSHSFEHINTVLSYAVALQASYGGDLDIITAAALLHDLGRSDPQYQGVDSALQSVAKAPFLLEKAGFPKEKTARVLQAIAEHDQPEVRPATLEGRILKDADFLAGFGAMGIVRSAMWTGETGGSMRDLMERLEQKMKARFASLEFAQSRVLGMQQYVFVRLFIAQLRTAPLIAPPSSAPYIFIEGISGAGKSTQVEMLYQRYSACDLAPLVLHEPTAWYSNTKKTIEIQKKDTYTQLLFLLADRYLNVRTIVREALGAHRPVISDRSYLSSMIYQAGEDWLSPANIAYLHTFLPQPTHIILLDTEPHNAMERIKVRAEAKGIPIGENETMEQLALHRQRFLSLTDIFPYMQIINIDRYTIDEVHEQILTLVMNR